MTRASHFDRIIAFDAAEELPQAAALVLGSDISLEKAKAIASLTGVLADYDAGRAVRRCVRLEPGPEPSAGCIGQFSPAEL